MHSCDGLGGAVKAAASESVCLLLLLLPLLLNEMHKEGLGLILAGPVAGSRTLLHFLGKTSAVAADVGAGWLRELHGD